jgi:signal transduction histidine kinase
MVALVGGVLAVSVWTVHRAGREAVRDFRAAETQLAQDTAAALHVSLDWFGRDTRLLAELTRSTRKQAIDARSQDDMIAAAFGDVVTVVEHYRTIVLLRPGRSPIVAIDPTEDRLEVAPVLVRASEQLAAAAAASGKTANAGPLTKNGRSFYLYAVPVGDGEAVVMSSDGALLIEAVARRATGSRDLVVVDPSGAAWLGCERPPQCGLLRPGTQSNTQLLQTIDAGRRDDITEARPEVVRLGMPARVVVGSASPIASPIGAWSVAVVAAAADIDVRQRAFLSQLVITSIAVALAMLAVGLLILRQNAAAAAMSARLQAADEVATLQRQLVRPEKLATVGVLSAGIAHEIGTPLAVVRVRAERMLERHADGRDVDDLQAVVGEIDRISSTIGRMLEFSRDQAVAVSTTPAHEAIERAVDLVRWRTGAKGITVAVDAPRTLPPLAVAADQLEQVILNLLMNASDASAPGSSVSVSAARDPARGDRVRIEVTDRGAGIPPQHLNSVFDPYFTTKKRGEGTGLGLAIVSQIVRSHRGEIALRSTVGVGTAVSVLWPTAAALLAANGAPHV